MSIPALLIDIENQLILNQQLENQIALLQAQQATETQQANIYARVVQMGAQIDALGVQADAIQALLNQVYNSLVQGVFGILHQIGNPAQADVAPGWYGSPPGGGSPAEVASAVWGFLMDDGRITETAMHDAGQFATRLGNTGVQFPEQYAPYIVVSAFWNFANSGVGTNFDFHILDLSTAHLYATPAIWLDAYLSGGYHVTQELNGLAKIVQLAGVSDKKWWCLFTQADWDAIRATQGVPLPTSPVAPVWPGLAKVTLGVPVAILPHLTITTPMDGVIVDITSVAPRFGQFLYGTQVSYRNIGALAFGDDGGDLDRFQALGFVHEVICPKSMTRAASVQLNCDPSVVGTVTPWTIT